MPLDIWFRLIGACLLISLTPGAGAINTMSLSLSHGALRTLPSVLGQQIALLLQVLIVAFGVGVLVQNHHWLLVVIRILGALYLVYLGISKYVEPPHVFRQVQTDAAQARPARLVMRGFMVNMLNPKAIVFVLAFVPLFITPSQPLALQYLVLTSTMVVIDIAVMMGFALLARQVRKLLRTEHHVRVLNRVFGVLFVVAGALLAFSSH
ncbi:LysE family transporter [Micrococcales bacterium 31B]|nr:LysE family transporter [Micrococcales bacterium 31B]